MTTPFLTLQAEVKTSAQDKMRICIIHALIPKGTCMKRCIRY